MARATAVRYWPHFGLRLAYVLVGATYDDLGDGWAPLGLTVILPSIPMLLIGSSTLRSVLCLVCSYCRHTV